MNTRPTADPVNATCQIERVEDDRKQSYLCCKPAKIDWMAAPDVPVAVCPACLRWLQTMESLGLPLL